MSSSSSSTQLFVRPLRDLVSIEPVTRQVGHGGDLGGQQVAVNLLALASLVPLYEGGHDGPVGVQGRHQVSHGHAHLHWPALRIPRHAHQAAHAGGNHIVPAPS